ncbi:MAG TPA: hypothetical protein VNB23_01955 [Ramlibacter sp.]|nr:hypothetical protein [Ramlibacter sp.]
MTSPHAFARFAPFLVAGLLAACAAPQPRVMPARTAIDAPYALERSPLLDQTSHTAMHLDRERRILYQQSLGGGGVGVGLLLGPLGVAANIAMIEANTKADVAKAGYRALLDHLSARQQAAVSATRPVTFRSEFFDPRFEFEMNGELVQEAGDLLWLRLPAGLYALRKPNVTITGSRKG